MWDDNFFQYFLKLETNNHQIQNLLINSQCFSNKYFDTGQIAAFPINKFKKIRNNNLTSSCHGYILPPEKSVDIDDITDWKLAEILYKGLKSKN